MTKYAARLARIYDGSGGGATALAAVQGNSIKVNGAPTDVTDMDSTGYRELLGSAGIVSVDMDFDALITDGTQAAALLARCQAQSIDNYEFRFGNSKKLNFAAQVVSFELTGEFQGAQKCKGSLQSSGVVVLT